MRQMGRSNKVLIRLVALLFFINLVVVAVYPIGDDGEQVWKVALRSLADVVAPTASRGWFSGNTNRHMGLAQQEGATKAERNSAASDRADSASDAMGEINSATENLVRGASDSHFHSSVNAGSPPKNAGASRSSSKDKDSHATQDNGAETPLPENIQTATALAEQTPSPEEETASPTPDAETPTPTQTPNPNARTLSLETVSVKPGGQFTLALFCNDVADAAGFDVGFSYPSTLLSFDSVQKSQLTSNRLLTKQIRKDSLSVSVAGSDPIAAKSGTLLTFGGVVAATVSKTILVPISFTRAKMYDMESRALTLGTQDGAVLISLGESDGAATPIEGGLSENDTIDTPTPFRNDGSQATPTWVNGAQATATALNNYGNDDDNSYDSHQRPTYTAVGIPGSTAVTPTPTLSQSAPTATAAVGTPPLRTATPLTERQDQTFLRTDLNEDGIVDGQDLFLFLREWNPEQ